jgi:P-type Mg2+ transporter
MISMNAPNEPPGLNDADVHERQQRFGPNEPAAKARSSVPLQLLLLFANPLAIILLLAALASIAVGEAASAGVIIVIVLGGAGINFWQSFRTQRAVDALRAAVVTTATVKRNGQWLEVPRRDLVPGDVIRLSAGDFVPADARLLSARDLHVQQAAMTGEALPVEKEVTPMTPGPARPDDLGAVFLGTSVVSGTALAEVTATGRATAFGDIVARLQDRSPENEFERGTRRFGVFISQIVIILAFIVLVICALLGRDPLESLLFAVALAVGLTPEFLPMIVAVTLARGAVRMARQKVIVKHLAAIQNLGSMDVLCSDKTGTLTLGVMELVRAAGPFGGESARVVELAYLNAAHETGIKSPLDAAILKRFAPAGFTQWQKRDEVPFDFERRRLSVIVENAHEGLLVCKGAPESVLACCTAIEQDGRVEPLTAAARTRIDAQLHEFGSCGFRVLGVAFRQLKELTPLRTADERELTFVGALAFLDPPRPDAAEMIAALRRDGVQVKVLSGDSDLVARHVCGQVGLDNATVVTGDDIDRLSDPALGVVAEKSSIFARLAPAQKTRVLLALKRRGHVVGYLGDGINDAPCLHVADVGISVAGAADVARDAAEVILLEAGLAPIRNGVQFGREAFGNVMKYLLMGTSSNFGNMISMAAATAFLPFLPMLPSQILLNGLLYDLAQLTIPTDRVDASYVQKPRRWDLGVIRRFMLMIGPVSSLFDFLTFGVLYYVFRADEMTFHTGWFVESLATQTLVLFVIRTGGNPFRSRPSRPLAITAIAVVLIGVALPYIPAAAKLLGFTPLPVTYLLFVGIATAAYLILVEGVKRLLLRRALR